MEWIRSDHYFGRRRAILCIPPEHVNDMVRFEDAGPDAAEDYLRQYIVNTFPSLAEATIAFMRFSFVYRCWEVGIEHPSLHVVADGCECPRIAELTGKEPTDA